MQRRLGKALGHWLAAEKAGDDRRSEKALRLVFLRLPAFGPAPDFVDRVLSRLGLAPAPPRGWADLGTQWKVVLGVCYALAATAFVLLPGFLAELWAGLRPGKLIDLGAGALVTLSERLADGIAVWETFSRIARLVSANVSSPAALGAVAAAALVSVVAFRLLHQLLISEGSSRYVRSV